MTVLKKRLKKGLKPLNSLGQDSLTGTLKFVSLSNLKVFVDKTQF